MSRAPGSCFKCLVLYIGSGATGDRIAIMFKRSGATGDDIVFMCQWSGATGDGIVVMFQGFGATEDSIVLRFQGSGATRKDINCGYATMVCFMIVVMFHRSVAIGMILILVFKGLEQQRILFWLCSKNLK